jgi:hypothetical protein
LLAVSSQLSAFSQTTGTGREHSEVFVSRFG